VFLVLANKEDWTQSYDLYNILPVALFSENYNKTHKLRLI